MSKFERCDASVNDLAAEILFEFATHKPLIDAKVTVDYVFAFADCDENTGEPRGHALTLGGYPCLGICRKMPLKDRALGRADAEISLDGDWWKNATKDERKALLDHELHHLAVKIDKRGLLRDDLGRPKLELRKHDFDFGWFKIIAERHGQFSIERRQAAQIVVEAGQYLFPDFIRS